MMSLAQELKLCAEESAKLDLRMENIRDSIEECISKE